ncbi:hypothetical protein FOCC_FOCC015429 [Frankliniella occidentalis]|nr:hypothetical protein FOCC_FOCC015429 [Frankliniella occidentalis]
MENYHVGRGLDEDYLVPDSLHYFLAELILSKSESRPVERAQETLAQSIMQASRPRSYISTIQLNLALYLHQNTASRLVIDVLHSLGLCSSYAEIDRFTTCFVNSGRPASPAATSFKQWAFDNADYNIKTFTGLSTFHEMVPRLKGKIIMDVSKGQIPHMDYDKPPVSGFKKLGVQDVGESPTPAWNGYMATSHARCGPYDVSQVDFLPFINLDPNDPNCIFTALNFAFNECTSQYLEYELSPCPPNLFDEHGAFRKTEKSSWPLL